MWPRSSTYVNKFLNGTSPSQRQQLCKIILKSMHKCTSYDPDKLNLRPFWPLFDPYDLDLQRTCKKMSQMALLLLEHNNCAKLFLKSMHKCTSYDPDKLNIWPFDIYLTPVTVTFNLPEKSFKWHLSSSRTTTVQNYFWNPCINVQVMARPSSIYDHFDLYLTPVTLTFFNLPKNVSNGTSPPRGQQLCKINFEIHA